MFDSDTILFVFLLTPLAILLWGGCGFVIYALYKIAKDDF